MKTKVYLAGPMRGIKDFNFPAFMTATDKLRKAGYIVFNPAERDLEEFAGEYVSPTGDLDDVPQFDQRMAYSDDLSWICEVADVVVTLPGWETSLGANAEVATARALGLPVFALKEIVDDD